MDHGRKIVRNAAILAVAAFLVVAGGYVAYRLSNPPPSSRGLQVLATFYPIYDFARSIAGEKAEVSLLVPMTVDVHNFQPTPDSVVAVAQAKLLIENGAGLEPWVAGLVSASGNGRLVQVDASAGIPLIPVPSQWQSGGRSVDPHIWLDPVLAKQQVANILAGLIRIDPGDSGYFTQRADAYDSNLSSLDAEARNLSAAPSIRSFVTFHTAFAYFAQQYNLTQIPVFGPFEEEPTPSDIQNVTDAVNRLELCYVGYESLENPAIPAAIANSTHATLIHLDPIEGLSPDDQAHGLTYLTKMESDLSNLSLSLNHVGCH